MLEKLISHFAGWNPFAALKGGLVDGPAVGHSTSRLRQAFVAAIALHVMLALLLPDMPPLRIPEFSRISAIKVFLNREEEAESFDQELNHQLPLANQADVEPEPALGSASKQPGDEASVTEATPSNPDQRNDTEQTDATGEPDKVGTPGKFTISRTLVNLFARREAVAHAEKNPDALERFRRSFRSAPSPRRRNKLESYKNRYGDYYVRAASSAGDICFLQERDKVVDDFATNIVYFYRCGKRPQRIRLGPPETVDDSESG